MVVETLCLGGGECVELLNLVVLLVNVRDRWVWKLHSSHWYRVRNAYQTLINNDGIDMHYNNNKL